MGDVLKVPTMAEFKAAGKQPEILFWVGCAGSFDDRARKITKAFVRLLNKAKVDFAVLGTEESCTGDPAKRSGNEFLFQMQAVTNIEVLSTYDVKKQGSWNVIRFPLNFPPSIVKRPSSSKDLRN